MAGLKIAFVPVGLLLATVLTAACVPQETPSQPMMVDGLSVGAPAGCGPCADQPQSPNCGPCDSPAVIARREIDTNWPGHAPIVGLTFYNEGAYLGPGGALALKTRSGHLFVAVATFADGSMHAVGVYCGVSGCLYLP